MSRCLSDGVLTRVLAELGTEAEQDHLAKCAACTMRYRQLTGEMNKIRHVLMTTTEPRWRAAPNRWRSVAAAAALSVAAVVALVWVEMTAWRAIQPATDVGQSEQMSAALADVAAALFSINGEPRPAFAESPSAVAPEPEGEVEGSCDESAGLDDTDCSVIRPDLENPGVENSDSLDSWQDPMDAIDVQAPERTALETESSHQGG